jgi:hypothetical protein
MAALHASPAPVRGRLMACSPFGVIPRQGRRERACTGFLEALAIAFVGVPLGRLEVPTRSSCTLTDAVGNWRDNGLDYEFRRNRIPERSTHFAGCS